LSCAICTDSSFKSKIAQTCVVYRVDIGLLGYFCFQVKDAKLEKFRAIASEPKDKNAFKIENYDRLKEVLVNFQKKIFKMEGDVQFSLFSDVHLPGETA